MEENAQRFDVAPSVGNHFAWVRTRMALERTFMAWMRTAVSLIGFGFTITQFFSRLREMEGRALKPMAEEAPRDLGLTLIAAGVVALVISAWQYYHALTYLRSPQFDAISFGRRPAMHTPVFLAAMVLIAVGVAAFIAVFFRFT